MIANLGSLGRILLAGDSRRDSSPQPSNRLQAGSYNWATALILLLALALPLAGTEPGPQPLPSPVFGEHMVLQRAKNVRLWGWSQPGTHRNIDLAAHRA